ncbi:ATP-binding protein [Candidatus Omnitrophota bacterium]
MELKINSDLKKIREVSAKILHCLNGKQLNDSFIFDIRLASEEAVINGIKHGNKLEFEKTVLINCDVTDQAVVVAVEDQGAGFDYKNLADPTQGENLIKGSGRGLFLIQNIMDKVKFNPRGNRITMTKFFPNTGGQKKCK